MLTKESENAEYKDIQKKKDQRDLLGTWKSDYYYIWLSTEEILEIGWLCCSSHAAAFGKIWRTASFVGSAGIAPLCVTVRAPHAFAKRRASLNRFSS